MYQYLLHIVLEEYFSRSLGFALLALGVMIVLLTGSVPLTSTDSKPLTTSPYLSQSNTHPASSAGVTAETADPTAPYAVPTVTISFAYHAATAFYSWMRWQKTSQLSNGFGTIGSGLLAAMGLWVLLFASSSGRISRKTGADKRTSNFPFNNRESASHRKSEWKKGR